MYEAPENDLVALLLRFLDPACAPNKYDEELVDDLVLTTRRELTAAIRRRYQAADRNGKKLILDEFVKLTRYHRKHATRLRSVRPPVPII